MSRARLLNLLPLLLAATLGCGGDDPAGPGPKGPLELDTGRAANDSIGPAGGTISATGTDGVHYQLIIPPNALRVPTRITITPVRAIRTLPVSGGTLGAMDLQPSGLEFAVPVKLRITAPTTAPSGTHLVGFSFEAQGDSVTPAVVADSGSSATVLLSHFSGGGAAFGTVLDIANWVGSTVTNPSQVFVDSLFVLQVTAPGDFPLQLQVMHDWFAQVIIPQLTNAGNDIALARAVGDYNLALETVLAYGIPAAAVLTDDKAAAAVAAAPRLRQAIDGNNALCLADRDKVGASNALFWQTQAEVFGIATPAEQLDRATVLQGLCLHVLITRQDFPSPAVANQAQNLDAQAGLQFGTDPNLVPLELFTWSVTATGTTSDGTQTGNSDVNGAFFTQHTPTGQQTLTLVVKMCLLDQEVPYLDVCGTATVTRQFGTTLTGNIVVNSQAGLAGIANVRRIEGNLTIVSSIPADPITSTDLRELSALTEVTGNFFVGALFHLTRLDGLRSLTTVGRTFTLLNDTLLTDMTGLSSVTSLGGFNLQNAPHLTAVTGLSSVVTLGDTIGLFMSNLPELTSIGGFAGIRHIKTLFMLGLPKLASLQAFRGTDIGDITIVGTAITNLNDLNGLAPFLPGRIDIESNVHLVDISALSGLQAVGGNLIFLDNDSLTSVAALANLSAVDGVQVNIRGKALSTVSLPNLQHTQAVAVEIGSTAQVSFPKLHDAGDIRLGMNTLCTGHSVAISLPLLDSARTVNIDAFQHGAGCAIAVDLASLRRVTTSVRFGGGVTAVGLGTSLTTPSLTFDQTSIGTLNVPVLNVGGLGISANPDLSHLGSGSGTIGTLQIIDNPSLSTQQAQSWAGQFSVVQVIIDRNGSP
jgi:hypothetical protein